MAIERLSFPEYLDMPRGIQISIEQEGRSALMRAALAYRDYFRRLDPGKYKLNPEIWERPASNHNLIVTPKGTGILRVTPRYDDTYTVDIANQEVDIKSGGRVFRLPQDQEIFVLAGPNKFSSKIHLYELIRYVR